MAVQPLREKVTALVVMQKSVGTTCNSSSEEYDSELFAILPRTDMVFIFTVNIILKAIFVSRFNYH
jgi:hypothetical protein